MGNKWQQNVVASYKFLYYYDFLKHDAFDSVDCTHIFYAIKNQQQQQQALAVAVAY